MIHIQAENFKNFIALRVNDSFNLLGVWAMPPYVEMIHDYLTQTMIYSMIILSCAVISTAM